MAQILEKKSSKIIMDAKNDKTVSALTWGIEAIHLIFIESFLVREFRLCEYQ